MTTETLPRPAPPDTTLDKPALHAYCPVCHLKLLPGSVALCGHESRDGATVLESPPAEWPLCVVCMDLVPQGCANCGAGR